MSYSYYPGCSLEYTAKPYDQSCRAVFEALGIELNTIEDWNCCGATAYMSVDKLTAYSVSARNLAIAERSGGADICAPCSSCYTILNKANRYIKNDPYARVMINDALSAANLSYTTTIRVRHPLDILVNDIGVDKIIELASYSLEGLKIAPYYGCQIVRPVYDFDDMDDPTSMDRLFAALGAEVVDYPPKVRCCGGMLMTTYTDVALHLNNDIISFAEEGGADVIATACPMCQMNVESYQAQINDRFETDHKLPVVYFTQLIGLALGVDPQALGLDSLLIPFPIHRTKIQPEGVSA